jgi:hypothetical protein
MAQPTAKIVITDNPDGTVSATFTREQVSDFISDMDANGIPHTSTTDTTDELLLGLMSWYRTHTAAIVREA